MKLSTVIDKMDTEVKRKPQPPVEDEDEPLTYTYEEWFEHVEHLYNAMEVAEKIVDAVTIALDLDMSNSERQNYINLLAEDL